MKQKNNLESFRVTQDKPEDSPIMQAYDKANELSKEIHAMQPSKERTEKISMWRMYAEIVNNMVKDARNNNDIFFDVNYEFPAPVEKPQRIAAGSVEGKPQVAKPQIINKPQRLG